MRDDQCSHCDKLKSQLDDARARADKVEKELAQLKQVGATGQFPCGRLGPGDIGELRSALYVKDGKLILDFGKDLSWLAMTKDDAMTFAMGLFKTAERLPR